MISLRYQDIKSSHGYQKMVLKFEKVEGRYKFKRERERSWFREQKKS